MTEHFNNTANAEPLHGWKYWSDPPWGQPRSFDDPAWRSPPQRTLKRLMLEVSRVDPLHKQVDFHVGDILAAAIDLGSDIALAQIERAIATRLGVPVGNVRKTTAKIRAMLKKATAEKEEAEAAEDGDADDGEDPNAGKFIVSSNIHDAAALFLAERYMLPGGVPTLYAFSGLAYRHVGDHYVPMDPGTSGAPGELAAELVSYFAPAYYEKETEKGVELVRYPTTRSRIGDLQFNAMSGRSLPTDTPVPFWVGATVGMPDPTEIIAFRNGLIHWPTGTASAHTPNYFNLSVLPYDYDPAAKCPVFDKFLGEAFHTQESRETLLEYMGLCLTDIMWFQAMLWLLGEPGTGRSTIVRLLKQLVGPGNTFVTSLGKIGTHFGSEGMIGKKLTVLPDVRISARHTDVAAPLEVFLTHTGEDAPSIPRKNKTDYEGGCTSKLLIVANEVPFLHDATGALMRRSIVLETQARLGAEEQAADEAVAAAEAAGAEEPVVDTQLGKKLAAELPGIAVQCLAALQRLIARGHFVQPVEGKQQLDELEHTLDPFARWMDAYTIIDPLGELKRKEAHSSLTTFYMHEGIKHVIKEAVLFRRIAARLRTKHKISSTTKDARDAKKDGGSGYRKIKIMHGIRLKTAQELADDDIDDIGGAFNTGK